MLLSAIAVIAWIATEVYFKHQEKNLENTALQ